MPKRSSKKTHKKFDVSHIESFVHDQLRDKDVQAALSAKSDSELFIDDKNRSAKALPAQVKIKKGDRTAVQRKLQQKKAELFEAVLKEVKRPKAKTHKAAAVYDLWDEPAKPAVIQGATREWVEPAIQKKVLPPKGFGAKPSGIPAVEVEEGASYRPTYDAHQDMLATALAVEVKKQEKDKKWDRMLRGERADAPKLENVPEVDDLTKKDEEDEEENDEDEEEDEEEEGEKQHNPYSIKLTRTQRNKMKRKVEQDRERAKKMELKAQRRKFEKLPLLLKELDEAEQVQTKQLAERRERKEQKALLGTKRLGPHRYEDGLKQVLLTDELPQSLRALKTPENPFTDRFKSLQKRNFIEPRKKVTQKRKYKKKTYEKRSTKMEWEL